jgi:hypothetical protein
MAKKIGATLAFEHEHAAEQVRKAQYEFARDFHAQNLQEIVSPFRSTIPINVQQFINNSGSLMVEIRATDGGTVIRPSKNASSSSELFDALNDGVPIRYMRMAKLFKNETFPDSLFTRPVDYDRAQNKDTGETFRGWDARNWAEQVAEKYSNTYRVNIDFALKRRT